MIVKHILKLFAGAKLDEGQSRLQTKTDLEAAPALGLGACLQCSEGVNSFSLVSGAFKHVAPSCVGCP